MAEGDKGALMSPKPDSLALLVFPCGSQARVATRASFPFFITFIDFTLRHYLLHLPSCVLVYLVFYPLGGAGQGLGLTHHCASRV